jgi:Fic family protein
LAKSKVYRPPFSTDGDVLALMDRPARWRSGDVGVMAGESAVHVAPSAHRVPGLMAELLGWLGRAEEHPLIASSVVHYELEFIHPFADGNGRIGRLWQTLILSRWRGLFADLPVETLVHAHQDAYYRAIAESTEAASATPFVLFMLTMKGVGRAYRLRSACPESRRPL